ncbi:OTU-domain-containing protein [Hypoxylon sp. FL1284]|nr:OTU-domain-containing protein [Hypoxylon sp. FL1284]
MESLEAIQARHRKEQRDLQGRITNKKKNATKKTRKGVNDECAELERQLKEKQEQELAVLNGSGGATENAADEAGEQDENSSPDPRTDGISRQLEQTSLSSPPSSSTQAKPSRTEPEPATSQQQPKKKSRQKERMARRAAEQEAAAAAAEQEAAGMTDHRGVEKASMEREFAAHKLVEKEIRPDGHCLFSAVADQLEQQRQRSGGEEKEGTGGEEPHTYKSVRRAATDYMQAHPDDFAPFLEEPLPAYAARMRDTAEWGGQLELAALARAFTVEIRVVQDGRTEVVKPDGEGEGEKEKGRQPIWLAYYRHGYGLGEHYNSLRRAE